MAEERATPGDVTRLIEAVGRGEPGSADALLDVVYSELRAMAAAAMAHERPGHTLQPTALVHEAYLRLMGGGTNRFANRAHFFAAAGEAMRRILVDQARRRSATKRGGAHGRSEMPRDLEQDNPTPADAVDILALDEALLRLEQEDPRMANIVKLRFFAGMTVDEVAAGLELSRRTVLREWTAAKAWLLDALGGEATA